MTTPAEPAATPDPDDYGADSIKVLKGLDAVRKRPGMYIGDTDDGSGLHHMVYEVVDNAIDEALAGHADLVTVTLNADGSCTVIDNGRGIPTDMHPTEGISTPEVVMTQLHAGGKFDQNSYKVSGGLHGVGVSVVNALSVWLKLKIRRNGKYLRDELFQRRCRCAARADRHLRAQESRRHLRGRSGTEITFLPAATTFTMVEFDYKTLEHRLRELAFLNSGVRIVLRDLRHPEKIETELHYEGGLAEFVRYLDSAKTPLIGAPIYLVAEKDGITVEVAMWWNDSYHENVLAFTNNIPQRDGGTHLAGYRAALTRQVASYAESSGILKREKVTLSGEDFARRPHLRSVGQSARPEIFIQTKDKLVSSEVRPVVENVVNDKLQQWFEEHPAGSPHRRRQGRRSRGCARSGAQGTRADAPQIRARRQFSRRQAQGLLREGSGQVRAVPRRGRQRRWLRHAGSRSRQSGRAAAARQDPQRRARPFRSHAGVRADRQSGDGARHSIGREEFNIDKLRYHRIIIMTDADVDGAHIRTLLLTFFYRQMRELIDRGHIYIAQPPLYKVKRGSSEQYLKDERALEDYLIDGGSDDARFATQSGSVHTGDDLLDIVRQSRDIVHQSAVSTPATHAPCSNRRPSSARSTRTLSPIPLVSARFAAHGQSPGSRVRRGRARLDRRTRRAGRSGSGAHRPRRSRDATSSMRTSSIQPTPARCAR